MGRMHLFEFEDQRFCPTFIRETTTDCLATLYRLKNIYAPALKKITEVLEKTKVNSIVDCCSGSGGPIKQLRDHLDKTGKASVSITLTDKYPNQPSFKRIAAEYPNRINASSISLDATNLPASFTGMRTLFSAFHHFKPEKAIKILQDAVNNNVPIGIFECTQRHPKDFIRMLFSPISMLILLAFSKKLTWKKFIFTYCIPITPFTHMWDFFVSILRTYSPQELNRLIKQLDAPHYQWEVGKLWSEDAKCYIIYLVGYNRPLA